MIELDYIIDAFSKTKVRKMKPLIRNLMRMGVYQIKYMDSIPDSAVCNESVKLAKRHKFGQLSGFVNGVLRNIARNIADLEMPEDLSIKYSMPQWIVDKWTKDYGESKTEEILKGFMEERPISIRTNLTRITPQQLKEKLIEEGVILGELPLEYAFTISGFDYLEALDSFSQGLFYVQDVSSMMVAEWAKVSEGDYVIDVCAAPGGKSTHVAELLNGTGMVEARDLTEYKVSLIEDNILRHELTNMKAVCMDATVFDEGSVDKADVLICDLPCSGLGVLAKKTDIRYKMSKEQQEELVQLQRDILSAVHSYVKPGGTLVYSTCTININENEGNVSWILEQYPEFELVEQKQLFPGEISNDGFFLAKLKKRI